MLKKEVRVGMVVLMKVSGKVVPCRIDAIDERSNWRGKAETIYRLTNTVTGKRCQARSAAKFRGEALPKAPTAQQVKAMFEATDTTRLLGQERQSQQAEMEANQKLSSNWVGTDAR